MKKGGASWPIHSITLILLFLQLTSIQQSQAFEVKKETELPVRYDEAQLWRIRNISQAINLPKQFDLLAVLEKNFGANIWDENFEHLDFSIEKKHVEAAKSFLKQYHLMPEVLHSNIQNLFDNEAKDFKNDSQTDGARMSKRTTSSGMDWQQYHDLATIYAYLHEMCDVHPNLCTLFNIGQTVHGRNLWVMRISENLNNKKIWIDGGIHAREWITPATTTFIIRRLLANWDIQPLYIKQKTWFIMPVINPDGYVYSRDIDRLWRKNRVANTGSTCKGVDLNRNFDIGWSTSGSSSDPCSDIYHGHAPASELETKAVKNFLLNHKTNLHATLTYHSYSQLILYPWAYKAGTVSNGAELQRVGELAAQRVQTKTGKAYETVVNNVHFGLVGGKFGDWSRTAMGTEFVYTMELRDKGQYGFVLPPDQIVATGEEAYTLAFTVAQAI